MTLKQIMESHAKESDVVLNPYKEAYEKEFQGIVDDIARWTDGSVYNEFGEFLGKALGNVNGSAVSIKNEVDKDIHLSYYSNESVIDGVVTAKKFGFKFRNRTNALYIDNSALITTLVQPHVDMIKRDKQRLCAQDFLNFKNCYFHKYNKLTKEITNVNIPLAIPAKFGKFLNVHLTGHKVDVTKYVLDSIVDGEITSMRIEAPELKCIDDTNIHTFKFNPKMSFNAVGKNPKARSTTFTFSGTAGDTPIKFKVELYMHDKATYDNVSSKMFECGYYDHTPKMLNQSDVLSNEVVKEHIGRFIDHNKMVAKSFEYTRMKYAKNIILNGMF